MSDDLRIRLLGLVGGSTDAGAFDAGPPRQQAVLAMLAGRAPQVVPIPDLIDGLWGGEPPRSAEQSIYTYVAGLRRALESVRAPRENPSIVVAVNRGYQLRIDPRQIDARLLALRLQEAQLLQQQGRHADALPLMEQALALSQGSPLSGVPGPFADTERVRLADLQGIAVERWAEALIHLGRPEETLPRLQETLARHPLRERSRELLMLGLSNSGRQAEALEVFATGQRLLADELGVDPGEGLRKTHELILRGSSIPLSDVPHQLPRQLSGFVGRARETIQLKTLLTPWDDDNSHPFVAIDTKSASTGCRRAARRQGSGVPCAQPLGVCPVRAAAIHRGCGASRGGTRLRPADRRCLSEMRSHGNLAHHYIVWKKYDLALRHAREQFEIAERLDIKVGMRYARMMEGDALRSLGKRPEAMLALTLALASAREDGDLSHQATIHLFLGEICLKEERSLDAVDHLRQALSMYQAVSFQLGAFRCLIRLSQAFRQLGRLTESLEHIEQAMPMAKTLESDPWCDEALAERAAVYAALGVPKVDGV